jgi:hypothetical protein
MVEGVHDEPFQWKMLADWLTVCPTIQTSLGPLPHTALRFAEVLALVGLHEFPFHRMIAPPSPTAQTSFALLPQTPLKPVVDTGLVMNVQPLGVP